MTWTIDEWDAFAALLENGWPGEFSANAGQAYRVLLDPVSSRDALHALQKLVQTGGRFRPSAAEIAAAALADPGRPTWDEAFTVLFSGSSAVLRCRTEEGALERAGNVHPYIESFLRVQGYDRLRMLEVFDPDFGEQRRHILGQAYDRHVQTCDDRVRTGRALNGSRGRGQLAQLNPLASLGIVPAAELVSGERS